ncbi:MAG: crossover junction endodeoxyribonuclease RuvC [Thermodesulfobacteriota bacterium]
MARLILGIDPGSRITGYGVIRAEGHRLTFLACGTIKVANKSTFADRLLEIFTGTNEVIANFKPQEMAIEDIFMAKNANSALKLGQARGVLLLAGRAAGLDIHEYTPRTIKQTVAGYGQAEKAQVQQAVRSRLQLSATPSQDAADGLAAAICHAHHGIQLRTAGK